MSERLNPMSSYAASGKIPRSVRFSDEARATVVPLRPGA